MDREEYRQAFKLREREREWKRSNKYWTATASHAMTIHLFSSLLFSSLCSSSHFSSFLFSFLFPFFLSSYLISVTGSELSMVDVMFAPFLERMAASLPYYKGFIVRGER